MGEESFTNVIKELSAALDSEVGEIQGLFRERHEFVTEMVKHLKRLSPGRLTNIVWSEVQSIICILSTGFYKM